MPLLFVVEDVFAIKERGVLAIGKFANADARFRIDDSVQVRHQDGSVIRTAITGIPMGMMKIGVAEVLLRGIGKSDILPGGGWHAFRLLVGIEIRSGPTPNA